MNLCVNGHDRDKVGTVRRRCKQCKLDEQRARRARKAVCDHPGDCEWVTTGAKPRTYCRTKASWSVRKGVRPKVTKDGFEDEFGPVPELVPSSRWFDRVAVQRHLRGEPIGRNLTRGEARGIHLLNVMNPDRSGVAQYPHRGTLLFSDGKRL